jgi:hypothetical protein
MTWIWIEENLCKNPASLVSSNMKKIMKSKDGDNVAELNVPMLNI